MAYGTALGVVRAAVEAGKKISVVACETRPLLQGARLTAFELDREGVPVTLITDNMAGYVMSRRLVTKVVVGADRVLATGHVVNKIGTLTLATLARAFRLPFYAAAPTSTFDLQTPAGEVKIEERSEEEVKTVAGVQVAPPGVPAMNPAFDITPPRLVSAIITEKGVIKPPYRPGIRALFRGASR